MSSELKGYHKNPRVITDEQLDRLKRDMEELGDLGGVVRDINSGEVIGGNQRSKIFNSEDAVIRITKRYSTPTRTGTVAEGYILYGGERFAYREVSWTPKQCEKANIVANKAGGDWDMEVLLDEFDKDDLLDWGFTDEEFGGMGEEDDEMSNEEINPDDLSTTSAIKFIYPHDVCEDTTNRLDRIVDSTGLRTREDVLIMLLEHYERHQ